MFSKCHRCLVNIIDIYKQFNFCGFETNGTPYSVLTDVLDSRNVLIDYVYSLAIYCVDK